MKALLGNKNLNLLSRMMDLHATRHRVIAENIANVNTPNYRRQSFGFEKAMRHALANGGAERYDNVRGRITRPNTTAVRNNGNNVDIEQEMLAISGNGSRFRIYSELYNRKSQMIKSAIRGGR